MELGTALPQLVIIIITGNILTCSVFPFYGELALQPCLGQDELGVLGEGLHLGNHIISE